MNNTSFINSLKNHGFNVQIRHYRTIVNRKGKVAGMVRYQRKNPLSRQDIIDRGFTLGQHGGKTVVELTSPNGAKSIGEAPVYYSDNYNYRLGATIALGRAWKPFSAFVWD